MLVDEVDSPQGDEVLALEAGLAEASEEDETSVPNGEAAVANDPSDFQISNGCLQKYVGFDRDVVIPDGVTSIGAEAFFYNKIVESVSIPNTVKAIYSYAFCGCESLKSIYIPDSVTSIGQGGFSGCISLKKARLSRNLNDRGYEGDWEEGWGTLLFDGCRSLEKVEIPNGIKRIGSYAFCYCESLKTVKIPASVTSIGEHAFDGCNNLDNIAIPEGVTKIEASTFWYCQNLNGVHVPASVTYIEKSAFEGCDNLVIRGAAGTYAERFANGMGIPFNAPSVSFENTAQGTMVRINQTLTFKAIQRPSDLAGALVWSSSNSRVATVDQKGRVKGIAKGEAIITAAPANGLGRAGTLRVVVPESTKITFSSESERVPMNEVVGIYARAVNEAYDPDSPVKWTRVCF